MFTESVRVGCDFQASRGGSLTLPNSCSRLWLHPPGNRLVLSTTVLSLPLPVLSYHDTSMSLSFKSDTLHLRSISSNMQGKTMTKNKLC